MANRNTPRHHLSALALIFILGWLLPGSLLAQTRPQVFSVHDLNRDGFLSKNEYRLFVQYVARWKKSPLRGGRRRGHPLAFALIDKNGDKLISEREMSSTLNNRLQKRRRLRYRGGR